MAHKEYPDINVDEIMRQIREEVAKRKAEASREGRPPPLSAATHRVFPAAPKQTIRPNVKPTGIWQFVLRIQHILQRFPFYDSIHRIARKFKNHIPRYKESYSIGELLQYHDEEFIQNAYRAILKRSADAGGSNGYLTDLRSGKLKKTEILGRLRYSREGRERPTKIKGLFLRFAFVSLYRIPVLGYVLDLSTSVVRLPIILRNIREYEGFTSARFTETSRHFNNFSSAYEKDCSKFENALKDKADIRTVDDLRFKVEEVSAQIVNMTADETGLLDDMYVAFEDEFRGARDEIKGRQQIYLSYIAQDNKDQDSFFVLDVGCGRGEWLELLKENGYLAKGVDINRSMVKICQELGLDVIESDGIEYLASQRADSVDMITGFHIVEHLPFKALVALFDESLRALKPGGLVIFETPNPENLIVGACNFYFDPSHKNPIPPLTLKFVAEARGFARTEIRRLHPYKYFQDDTNSLEQNSELTHLFNGEADYSIIAYKA